MGDHLWISRYILQRIAEDFNVSISFSPKIFRDLAGAGCHTNFSTKTMRAGTGGMEYINQMMEKMAPHHDDHISVYDNGYGNINRLTGEPFSSNAKMFSFGVGNRDCSIRIPTGTFMAGGAGYIEDRRPSSNCDPYVVCGMIVNSGVGTEDLSADLKDSFRSWKAWRTQHNLDTEEPSV